MMTLQMDRDTIEEVYIELRDGKSVEEIAKMFGTSKATIQNLNTGKYYRDPDMSYPIRNLRADAVKRKKCREPGENSPFWDSYIPEPAVKLPELKRRTRITGDYRNGQ